MSVFTHIQFFSRDRGCNESFLVGIALHDRPDELFPQPGCAVNLSQDWF
jgi:hypothetical protein